MTEGISKETLESLIDMDDYGYFYIDADKALALCTELDPWMPIDENTPKDRELLLLSNEQKFIGEWCKQHSRWEDNCGCEIYPTRYKLLSEDPK